jgi:glycosyltransferase involved in cell wall biosynthesis
MTTLRILHVTPYYAGAWAYGGIPRLVPALVSGLSRRDHQVTVCTTDACSPTARASAAQARRNRWQDWTWRDDERGALVHVFPNVSNRMAYRFQLFLPIGLSRFLATRGRSFDIAHLHACRNLPTTLAARALGRAGIPVVLSPNGTAPRIERRMLAKAAYDLAFGDACRQATAVLAVSEAERRQLLAHGVDAAVVRILPNPVDLAEFAQPVEPGRFRRRFGLGDAQVVLYLGRLSPRKRIEALVGAFASLGQERSVLVLAGADMGAGRSITRRVCSVGIGSRTVFTGLLEGRDRLEALADADVVVYAAQQEVFGLVALEALLSGTPVVVGDDSGCGEVVSQVGGGLLVPPGDEGALAGAVRDVLGSPAVWKRAAREAALRVRAEFGADRVCERLDEIYGDILGRV